MQTGTNRILTTHGGRLEGPPELAGIAPAPRSDDSIDPETVREKLRDGIVFVLRKQAQAGIDIVSNGELTKLGYGIGHFGRRFSGLSVRQPSEDEPSWMAQRTGERMEFAEFYSELNWSAARERIVCTGPIRHIGQREVDRDIALFNSALSEADVQPRDAFMCALSPGWLEHFFHNEFYANDDEYLLALSDALRDEYRAIVDAGFVLQIDDPALPDTYDMIIPQPSISEYRRFASIRIDALNHALDGLPPDRVRYHICWGSWHGPHTHDLPLEHVVDLMLRVNAGAYSVEAANPRHAHEWKIWKDWKLPDGKKLIPGVVSHATNVVEHPELVADRLVRFANLVGRDNVVAGTDCGLGLRVHRQIAWAKLEALTAGAAMASEQLWRGREAPARARDESP